MNLRQLLVFAHPYRWRLLLTMLFTTTAALVMLAVPWLAGQMVGGIVAGATGEHARMAVLLVFCLASIAILSFATSYQSTTTTALLLADVRQRVFEHVQCLPLDFHDRRSKGDTLALVTVEISHISNFLTGTLTAIPSKLLTTLGAIILMFRIDARLALIVPMLIPAFYLILKLVGRRLRTLGKAWQVAEAHVIAVAEEALEMMPATKAFNRERAQTERYRSAVQETVAVSVREGRIYAAIEPLIGLIAALTAVGILLLAGLSAQSGQMNSSELFSFIFYAALLTRPVGALAHVYGQVQSVRGILERLQAVLGEAPEIYLDNSSSAQRSSGDIRFTNVRFAYPGRVEVLRGLNLHVASGETVALLGPNGAGKTALINLLMRYYLPQSGTITIDGVDTKLLLASEVRQQIGLVPQSAFLFNGTIRDNIGFGANSPGQDQIDEAARLAQAYDFIMELPEKMETRIGDRGLRLSGGQRQRIALARALINDPPILIFDEATSMFDEAGESAFIEACSNALEDRTVILVTHRPATLALADRVLVLEEGHLSEDLGHRRLNQATA